MRKFRLLGAVCACVFVSMPSHAKLVDNGGGLIYDDVLDIAWAQPDGVLRNWEDATDWAQSLFLGGVFGWRLPYVSVEAGLELDPNPVDCDTASEAACRDNELGYMFYQNLSGTFDEPILDSDDPDLALFPSLQSSEYWSEQQLEGGGVGLEAWDFLFQTGQQNATPTSQEFGSWAVHPGNVLPGTEVMLDPSAAFEIPELSIRPGGSYSA